MDKRIATAAAVAALAAASIVALNAADLGERGTTNRRERKGESRLALLPDAGKGYVYPSDLDDGGTEWVTTDEAPCVRRPAHVAAADCLRREPDGGVRDYGTLNRFPADEAVGSACQPVACAVLFGDDAEAEEDARLDALRTRAAEPGAKTR